MGLSEKWKAQGYGDDEGHYTFDKDVIIRTNAGGSDMIPAQRYYAGGIVVDEESSSDPKTINMNGHRLTLNSTADSAQRYAGGVGVWGDGRFRMISFRSRDADNFRAAKGKENQNER